MGNLCLPPDRLPPNNKVLEKEPSSQSKQEPQPTFGITLEEDTLRFHHSPFTSSEYLLEKFYYDSRRPDEINLLWQILKVELKDSSIRVHLCALKSVNLWVVVGGCRVQGISGLFTMIKECKFVSKKEVEGNSGEATEQLRDFQIKTGNLEKDSLYIILESQQNKQQSLFLINCYQTHSGKLHLDRQHLQWNGLAFELQDIYGQEEKINLNQIDQQKTECIICNQLPAECILLPCRHLCICKECLPNFKQAVSWCPLCKTAYEEIIIYKPVQSL